MNCIISGFIPVGCLCWLLAYPHEETTSPQTTSHPRTVGTTSPPQGKRLQSKKYVATFPTQLVTSQQWPGSAFVCNAFTFQQLINLYMTKRGNVSADETYPDPYTLALPYPAETINQLTGRIIIHSYTLVTAGEY